MLISKLDTYNNYSLSEKFTMPLRGILGGRVVVSAADDKPLKNEKIYKLPIRVLLSIGLIVSGIGILYLISASIVILSTNNTNVKIINSVGEKTLEKTALEKTALELLKTAENVDQIYALLEKHPELINQKIDWVFSGGTHLYEDRKKISQRPVAVKDVYLSHMLCAGSLADPEKSLKLLQSIHSYINFKNIDDSNLFGYVNCFHNKCSGNNVLKTAIAAASGSISGTPQRRDIVAFILSAIEGKEDRIEILNPPDDHYFYGSHTPAEFLIRQGYEDLALQAIKGGAIITPKTVLLAAASLGTTKFSTTLIDFVSENCPILDDKIFQEIKGELLLFSIEIQKGKSNNYYTKHFGSLDTVSEDKLLEVRDIVKGFAGSHNLSNIELRFKSKDEIAASMAAMKISWNDVVDEIVRNSFVHIQLNSNGISSFTDQFRERNSDPIQSKKNWMVDKENVEKAKHYVQLIQDSAAKI